MLSQMVWSESRVLLHTELIHTASEFILYFNPSRGVRHWIRSAI